MTCYLCYRECRGWRACVRGVLMWVVCLRWWRASVSDVLLWVKCWRGLCGQRARVACQHGWHGWCTTVGKVDGVLWLAWLAY